MDSGLNIELEMWVGHLGRCLNQQLQCLFWCPPLHLSLATNSPKYPPPGFTASDVPLQPWPHSLMHLFMSGLRASKYPGGQDGKQTPTWRMSFLSSKMNSLGEHLRQPLTSEQSSQPLAQAWLPSALTAV